MNINLRKLTLIAMLSSISVILSFLKFSFPLIPGFIKMDFSYLPALFAALALGSFSGILVCLLKTLIILPFSHSIVIGTLADFLLCCSFTFPAKIIYKKNSSKFGAFLDCLVCSLSLAVLSFPVNRFIVYPLYFQIFSEQQILNMYQFINPQIKNITEALLLFNVPFNLIKGLLTYAPTFFIYRRSFTFFETQRSDLI